MKHRSKHFMKAGMLPSQFEALEEPSDAIVSDISLPPSAIVVQILAQLRRPATLQALQTRKMVRSGVRRG
jgi:gluconate kinase